MSESLPPSGAAGVGDGAAAADVAFGSNGNNSAGNNSRIQQLSQCSKERILAGQAIADLPTAVKELVDNALDARARNVNVRLFNLGLDIIEVSDNGTGVPPAGRALLAAPHATSKLRSLHELYGYDSSNNTKSSNTSQRQTLGFRGEALFSLAHQSRQLVVATRCQNEALAQKLEYNTHGQLVSCREISKKVGTTVAVVGLLHQLPVRRSHLERTIQTQRRQLVRLVQSYAVFSIGIQLSLRDIVTTNNNNTETTILSSSSKSTTLREATASVLGPSVTKTLGVVQVGLEEDDDAHGVSLENDSDSDGSDDGNDDKIRARLEALVSRADTPLPSNSGGQFVAINGRPVDLPQLTRRLNALWKAIAGANNSSRQKKRPTYVLSIYLPMDAYDVNVSPDKRTVLLTREAFLLERITTAIQCEWQSQTQGTFSEAVLAVPGGSSDVKIAAAPIVSVPAFRASPDRELKDKQDDGGNHTDSAHKLQHPLSDSPSRFNRRYAFSHDLRRARLQHEFDDGRQRGKSIDDMGPSSQLIIAVDDNDHCGINDRNESNRDSASKPSVDTGDKITGHNAAVTPSPASHALQTPEQKDNFEPRLPQAAANELPDSPIPDKLQDLVASSISTTSARLTVPLALSSAVPPPQGQPNGAGLDEVESIAERKQWHDAQRRFNAHDTSGLEIVRNGACKDKSATTQSVHQLSLERFGFRAAMTPGISQARTSTPTLATLDGQDRNSSHLGSKYTPNGASSSKTGRARTFGTERTPLSSDTRHISALDDSPALQLHDSYREPRGSHDIPDRHPEVVWESFSGTKPVLRAAQEQRLATMSRKKRRREETASVDCDDESDDKSEHKTSDEDGTSSKKLRLFKNDFVDMQILGQFNMGFILARSRDDNLWILDQHACDEKYNFERLMVETKIHEQRLIAPMALELSVAEETCVLDHLDVFEMNGFRFKHYPDREPRHRLALTAMPHSGAQDGRKAVQFGKEDVSALCTILGGTEYEDDDGDTGTNGGTGTDGSGVYGNNAVRRYVPFTSTGIHNSTSAQPAENSRLVARLPKAIAMFASRACRGSIMIGKALSSSEMERVVRRLSTIDQPWNCPHGRPTMQHLGDIGPVLLEDERRSSEYTAGPTLSVMSQDECE